MQELRTDRDVTISHNVESSQNLSRDVLAVCTLSKGNNGPLIGHIKRCQADTAELEGLQKVTKNILSRYQYYIQELGSKGDAVVSLLSAGD